MYCADTYQARFATHPFHPHQSQYAYLLSHYTPGPDMADVVLYDSHGRPFVLGAVFDATIAQRRVTKDGALDQSAKRQKHSKHPGEWQAYTDFHDIQYDQCFGDLVRYRAALRERADMMEDWGYPKTPIFNEINWQGPKLGSVCTPPTSPRNTTLVTSTIFKRLSPPRSRGAATTADYDMEDAPAIEDGIEGMSTLSGEGGENADFTIELTGRFPVPPGAVRQDHRTQRLSPPRSQTFRQARTEHAENTIDSEDPQGVKGTVFWNPEDFKPFDLEAQQGIHEESNNEGAEAGGISFWGVDVLNEWLGK